MSDGVRKLAAMMMTDMVGYTALTQSNESRALAMLETHRRLLREIFPRHRGQEIKTIGDAFIAEFESAFDACLCALEIQRMLSQHNSASGEEPILIRIGIHTGDVIHRDGDVFGDTINVLSRIEPLAEPGGICVSQQVFDQVRNKVDCPFLKVERPEMKNVEFPVNVYRAVLPWVTKSPRKSGSSLDRLRVVVLPFLNISPDKSDDYLVDGMTEEMIARLSRVKGLQVIARTSAMHYKGKDKPISDIGAELKVGSVLEGSVRKYADKIRVNVELVDVGSESQLWSNTYDRELRDVFAIQGEIAESVVNELEAKQFQGAEAQRKEVVDITAYTYYLKGRHLLYERTDAAMNEAAKQFRMAIAHDQKFARAYVGLADCLYLLGYYGYNPARLAYAEAERIVGTALELDDGSAEAHSTKGVLLVQDKYDVVGAEKEFKKAIELNPGYAQAHHWYAFTFATMGRLEEAIRQMELAQEADPMSPIIAAVMGGFCFELGREEQALKLWALAAKIDPGLSILIEWKAEYLISKGRAGEAVEYLRNTLALSPDSASIMAMLGYALAVAGSPNEAVKMLDQLKTLSKRRFVPAGLGGFIHVGLGEIDDYFGCVEQSLEEKSLDVAFLRNSPLMASVRSDPRYPELLRRIGLG